MSESVLIVATAASLGLALAMGMIVFVLLRHERRRSNARVAMLAEMAAERPEASSSPAEIDLVDDFASELAIEPASGSDLFAAPPARSAWPSRVAIAGALLVVLFVAGSVLRGRIATPSVEQKPIAAQTGETAQLDLLSLRHAQQPGSLTITGLVQNPRTGTPLSKITATAMLFGESDTFVASGRTPLDMTMLRPGDESEFVITIALEPSVSATVTRYRVGFRGDDGRIIGHVDRRSTSPIARGPS